MTGRQRGKPAAPPRPVWCKPLFCALPVLATGDTRGRYASDDALEPTSAGTSSQRTAALPTGRSCSKGPNQGKPRTHREHEHLSGPATPPADDAEEAEVDDANDPHREDAATLRTTTRSVGLAYSWLKSGATTQMRRTLAFTCRARLNDWPRSGHTSAPCRVQRVVVRHWRPGWKTQCSRLVWSR